MNKKFENGTCRHRFLWNDCPECFESMISDNTTAITKTPDEFIKVSEVLFFKLFVQAHQVMLFNIE